MLFAQSLLPVGAKDLHTYNSSIQGGYSCADSPSERFGPGSGAGVAVGGSAEAGDHVNQTGHLFPVDTAELISKFIGSTTESNDVWGATER